MDFEADPFIEQLSRNEREERFGLIICAIFHQPKPVPFVNFYNELVQQLTASFTDDEKQSVYIYPIPYLHITIGTLYNFKHDRPESPEKCLQHWKKCFNQLKQTSKSQPIILTLDEINLSKAAGYFQYKDEANCFESIRQSIRKICVPEDGQSAVTTPNIVHTSFIRFSKKPQDPVQFEEKFHRICQEVFTKTNRIVFEIDEICLAFEARPYMHIDCDEFHVLDTMKS